MTSSVCINKYLNCTRTDYGNVQGVFVLLPLEKEIK